MVLISQILKRYLHKESFLVLVVSFVLTDKLSKVRLIHTRRTAIVTDTHVEIVVVKQCILQVLLFLRQVHKIFISLFFFYALLRTYLSCFRCFCLFQFLQFFIIIYLFIYRFSRVTPIGILSFLMSSTHLSSHHISAFYQSRGTTIYR